MGQYGSGQRGAAASAGAVDVPLLWRKRRVHLGRLCGRRLKDDFWQTLELEQTPGNYPYGGIHNGNNFLVYPPLTEGGAVLPSLRLKVLRAGMQDLAIMRAAQALLKAGKIKGARAQKLQALLNPVPAVFVHPHYWDRLPETLLKRRAENSRHFGRSQ